MEKQDPGLRAACYVAKEHIEQYLSYARTDLCNLLSANQEHDQKKEALAMVFMKKYNISGFDSFIMKDKFLLDQIGPIKFNNYISFKNLYLESITNYRENIQKLNLVLDAIVRYLDDINRSYISINLDDGFCINTKDDLVLLLGYMDMPEHMIQKVADAEMYFKEPERLTSSCEKKIAFMLAVRYLLSTIIDPLIERWEKGLRYTFNSGAIKALMDLYLGSIDRSLSTYYLLLSDNIEAHHRQNIVNIIESLEESRIKVEKTYNDQLCIAKNIKEVMEPMKLLRECMQHAAYTGTSFSFLSKNYDDVDDLVELAELLLDRYSLKMRLPKSPDLIEKFKQYIASYKS